MGSIFNLFNKNQKSTGSVVCSRCGEKLKVSESFAETLARNSGNRVYGTLPDSLTSKHILGTVCTRCDLVFCHNCQAAGWASPCRKCGHPVDPATGNIPKNQKKLGMDVPPYSEKSLPGSQP